MPRRGGKQRTGGVAPAAMRSGNFNASHTSLAAVEADLYDAALIEHRRAQRGELLWDGSRDIAKEFPKLEKRAVKSISKVFVRSNAKASADGGKLSGITQRPLDTAHLIKRRQKNGLRPVTYVDEDLLERRKIARARMNEIVEKVVKPITGAYRHLMRLLRTSKLRVGKHPDVCSPVVAITEAVNSLQAQRERPLDLSSNGNVVRHLQRLLQTAAEVDQLLDDVITTVENVRLEQLEMYMARVADDFALRKSLFEDFFAAPYQRFKECLHHVDCQPLLGRVGPVRNVIQKHQDGIVLVAETFAVPLNAFSDALLKASYRGLVLKVRAGIRRCVDVHTVVEREKAALDDRLARVEKQRRFIAERYPLMLDDFTRCKALIDGSLDGLGSIPAVVNGLAETKSAMGLLAEIVDSLDDNSVALTEDSVREALAHRDATMKKATHTVRSITATADTLNLGPTRKRLKRLTAMIKNAQDLDHRGPEAVARTLKAARVAVTKCTDGLIWTLTPADLGAPGFLRDFGRLIKRADAAVDRAEVAVALQRRTQDRAARAIQAQLRLGRNPDFDSESDDDGGANDNSVHAAAANRPGERAAPEDSASVRAAAPNADADASVAADPSHNGNAHMRATGSAGAQASGKPTDGAGATAVAADEAEGDVNAAAGADLDVDANADADAAAVPGGRRQQ